MMLCTTQLCCTASRGLPIAHSRVTAMHADVKLTCNTKHTIWAHAAPASSDMVQNQRLLVQSQIGLSRDSVCDAGVLLSAAQLVHVAFS